MLAAQLRPKENENRASHARQAPGFMTTAYDLTDAGRNAWQTRDKAIPRRFRLVLWLIDFYGDDYLADLTRRYSTSSLPGLLTELEDLRLIKRRAGIGLSKRNAASHAQAQMFNAQQQRQFEDELRSASHSLLKGA